MPFQPAGPRLPSALPRALGMQGGWGKYLYVQVEDAVAVQVIQPLRQLLDVDLDLQWQRPLHRQDSQP